MTKVVVIRFGTSISLNNAYTGISYQCDTCINCYNNPNFHNKKSNVDKTEKK